MPREKFRNEQVARLRNPNQKVRVGESVTVNAGKDPWVVAEIIPGWRTRLKLSRGEETQTVESRLCDPWRGGNGDA